MLHLIPMSNLKLNDAALPILFRSADTASLKAQTSHYRVLIIYLSLLVLSAVLSFVLPQDRTSSICAAALFSVTLILSIVQARSRSTEIWYSGRAIAESVKTSSWRWVMRADPYHVVGVEAAEQAFTQKLKEILSVNKISLDFSLPDAGLRNSVSDTMRQIRNLSFSERLQLYVRDRVDDQADWYKNKSKINRHRAKFWRAASVALNLLALVLLVFRIADPDRRFPIDVIAAVAGAVVSWIEAKKYSELKSSYRLAAAEIGEIQVLASNVTTDAELAKFVLDSENAFSREHTQWFARRT